MRAAPRLVYRGQQASQGPAQGFTEADHTGLLHAAHHQLGGPAGSVPTVTVLVTLLVVPLII